MYENTFARAKDTGQGLTTLGWNIGMRKDALKRVEKLNFTLPQHPSSKLEQPGMEIDILLWGRVK